MNKDIKLDEREVEASALLDGFTIPEMEEVIEADLFVLMGVNDKLSQEQKDDLVTMFEDTVQKRIVSRILGQLDEEGQKNFVDLAEKNPEEAEKFLEQQGVNKEQITISEIILYKLELAKKKPK